MRLLLKVLAVIIFGPIIIGLALILGIAALVAVPILWEQLVARFTAPPPEGTSQS